MNKKILFSKVFLQENGSGIPLIIFTFDAPLVGAFWELKKKIHKYK